MRNFPPLSSSFFVGGQPTDSEDSKVKAQTRCNIKRDAGLTRANSTGVKYCCLFFARGCCPYGWECEYLHSLPDTENPPADSSKDTFARDKFADYRDDMGGVGSFNRQNRTLYVGRIKETGSGLETEEIVRRHFKEWGEIERGESYEVLVLFLTGELSSPGLQMTPKRAGQLKCFSIEVSRS